MWLHSLKVSQLLRSAACLHTNQSRSYLNHHVFSVTFVHCTDVFFHVFEIIDEFEIWCQYQLTRQMCCAVWTFPNFFTACSLVQTLNLFLFFFFSYFNFILLEWPTGWSLMLWSLRSLHRGAACTPVLESGSTLP